MTAISLAGLTPLLSVSLNAFWISLLVQALFFIYAVYIQSKFSSVSKLHSKTLEIVENETVSKFRQSKEQAELDRLMKVIEQERKVLGELRKSEARRAEEMKQEKERADDANRAKSAFLAVVSHEIRTPMSGIMGMVKMLLDSSLDKKQKEYAQTIQESADAMLALLNDILDFEKVEQGKMDIENIGFDLKRLMNGVATLMNGHASQKNIKLIVSADDKLPQFVKGDPTRLRQILLNLTGNAIKFTNEGHVTLTAKLIKKGDGHKPHEIYFGVTDSGVGISKEGQQKIFDAFSQADKSVSRKFGGTGLGLAISKGLVDAMGGSIAINSIEGEGSTFFFTLDMDDAAQEEKATENKKIEIEPHHKAPLSILVVEDNDINIKVVKSFLEKSPHKIDISKTAEDAEAKLKLKLYDVALMDIELPDMNGDELTEKLNVEAPKAISKTIILALTGNVSESDRTSYLSKGMHDLIEKPIKPENLDQALNNVVGGVYKKKTSEAEETTIKQDETKADEQSKDEPIKGSPVSRRSTRVVSRTSFDKNKNVVTPPDSIPKQEQTAIFDQSTLETLKSHLEPDQLQEMLDDVFNKSDEIIAGLKIAKEQNNTLELKARAHELKGMSGNFGLIEISDHAGQIEELSKSGTLEGIEDIITQMPTDLANAKAAVENWLKS
ncbi:MAG: ATP-binding protein [Pseudomonadota bacterium]